MTVPKVTESLLAGVRLKLARDLEKRIKGKASLTLTAREVRTVAALLAATIPKPVRGRPKDPIKPLMDMDMVDVYRNIMAGAPRQPPPRGWKSTAIVDVAEIYGVDEKTVQRAVKAYDAKLARLEKGDTNSR
jgi:hypothetical protein